MKVVVFTAVHQRKELTVLFFENLKRQGIDVYCACSTDWEFELYKGYCNDIIVTENNPVSNKFNASIELLRGVDFDYAMILGSDDFVSDNFIDVVSEVAESDYIGFNDIYFYRPKDSKIAYMKYSSVNVAPIGAGSLFSKRLLNDVDYKLFDEGLDSRLDTNRHKRLTLKGYNLQVLNCKELGVEMVDVKHSFNITNPNIVNVLDLDELRLINTEVFNYLPLSTIEHIKRKNMVTKKQGKRIEIVKDYLDLNKGQVYTVNAKHANGLIEKGVAVMLDDEETKKLKAKKKEVKANKEPTLKELRAQYPDIKATSVKAFKEKLAKLEHDCEDCDSDNPCKGCEESAQTTNKPKR